MRTLALLVLLLGLSFVQANAQEADAPEGAIVDSSRCQLLAVRVSPGLQKNRLLVGRRSIARTQSIVSRIEANPVIAAVRSVAAPTGARHLLVVRSARTPISVKHQRPLRRRERDLEGRRDVSQQPVTMQARWQAPRHGRSRSTQGASRERTAGTRCRATDFERTEAAGFASSRSSSSRGSVRADAIEADLPRPAGWSGKGHPITSSPSSPVTAGVMFNDIDELIEVPALAWFRESHIGTNRCPADFARLIREDATLSLALNPGPRTVPQSTDLRAAVTLPSVPACD